MVLSRIPPKSINKFIIALQFLNVFHLCIPHESRDDGLSGPKHAVSGIIKMFVCVTVTPQFYL
jgi:hypothetical protein